MMAGRDAGGMEGKVTGFGGGRVGEGVGGRVAQALVRQNWALSQSRAKQS